MQGPQVPGRAPQDAGKFRQPEGRDLLVRVVQHGVEVAADVGHGVIEGADPAQQGAAHLSGGVGGGVGGLSVDEIRHGLGLGQVHAPVEEGPPGELSGACLPGAGGEEGVQPRSQHRGGAVALQLDRVLAGVGGGGAAADGEDLVDDPALPIQERTEAELPLRRVRQRHAAGQTHNAPRDLGAAGAGQAQNADGAGSPPGGDGGNDVHADPSDLFSLLYDEWAVFSRRNILRAAAGLQQDCACVIIVTVCRRGACPHAPAVTRAHSGGCGHPPLRGGPVSRNWGNIKNR